MSTRDKWVHRFSVDETAKHKNGFTIYKITSVLFPIDSPAACTAVSVWKRYRDVQSLHKSMRSLHAGLYLRGTFPALPRYSYFKRFQKEVIGERTKAIKTLLEAIAEHRLLVTSTEFVYFLQSGYPEPKPQSGGLINAIRSSLHLPIEETPPLEYQTDDDDGSSPAHIARAATETPLSPPMSQDETDFISQIPIYEAADVEIRHSPKKVSLASSFESINSLDSIDSDIYEELSKVTVDTRPSVKSNVKTVLPDLINFDAPSTSKFEDYHTMRNKNNESDTVSLNSNVCSTSSCDVDSRQSSSRVSLYSKSVLSLSNAECKTKTEVSYVFEAGYMLNLAARCEDMEDYHRAFEYYKSGIEKMLIGVQTDTDPQRRALIKQKTNKYLSYAEQIYKNHLCDADLSMLPERDDNIGHVHCPIPLSMLKRPYEELSLYRVLAILGSSMMLVHRAEQTYYAMKVIQKVPNNLTEFDEYFLQRANETRQPILPTVIPYMVPLQAYIETNNLIFLILSYAPGKKLIDYIKNYKMSVPSTPVREVNLENVFTEPKNKNVDTTDSTVVVVDNNNVDASDVSTKQLVLNSQRLLLNVDKVLTEGIVDDDVDRDTVDNVAAPPSTEVSVRGREVIPPSAVCKWAAEILTALESLHNCGVVCRDLNPNNILLGERGQIILTYFIHYGGAEMRRHRLTDSLYVSPELYHDLVPPHDQLSPVCDFWSFGAVLYELICGEPLSNYHRSIFTSHTILHLPDGLTIEEQSLLTQLLTYDPCERLGSGKDGIEEIKRHPYFKHIDWQCIYDSWTPPD